MKPIFVLHFCLKPIMCQELCLKPISFPACPYRYSLQMMPNWVNAPWLVGLLIVKWSEWRCFQLISIPLVRLLVMESLLNSHRFFYLKAASLPPSSKYELFQVILRLFSFLFMFFKLWSSVQTTSCHFWSWKWQQTYSRDETDVMTQSGCQDFVAKLMFPIFRFHVLPES